MVQASRHRCVAVGDPRRPRRAHRAPPGRAPGERLDAGSPAHDRSARNKRHEYAVRSSEWRDGVPQERREVGRRLRNAANLPCQRAGGMAGGGAHAHVSTVPRRNRSRRLSDSSNRRDRRLRAGDLERPALPDVRGAAATFLTLSPQQEWQFARLPETRAEPGERATATRTPSNEAGIFPRRRDAQQFLTSVDHSRATNTYVDPALGRITFGSWEGNLWTVPNPRLLLLSPCCG